MSPFIRLIVVVLLCSLTNAANSQAYHQTAEELVYKRTPNKTHEVVLKHAGKGTVTFTIAPLPPWTTSYQIMMGSLTLTVTGTDVKLSGEGASQLTEKHGKRAACSLTHPKMSQLKIWVSISAVKPAFIKLGYGYRMTCNVVRQYTGKPYNSRTGHWQEPSLKNVTTISIGENVNLARKTEFCELPIVLDPSPNLVPVGTGNWTYLTGSVKFYSVVNLPEVSQRLSNDVNKVQLTDEQIESINYSLDNVGCTLQAILKSKVSFSGNTKSSYIRVPMREGMGSSPGQEYVLEIWPKGHYSPIHDHGDSAAVIRILHGSLKSEWFNPIVNNSFEEPERILTAWMHKGEVTWMLPHLFQTHRLTNERNDTAAITIQAYGYPDKADDHSDVFSYVLPGDSLLHEFFPNSDIRFVDLLVRVTKEYKEKKCLGLNPAPECMPRVCYDNGCQFDDCSHWCRVCNHQAGCLPQTCIDFGCQVDHCGYWCKTCRIGYTEQINSICPDDQRLCGNSTCYDPSQQTCFRGHVCLNGERLCGTTCFDPSFKTCLRGKLLPCEIGQRLCAPDICYDPDINTCFGGKLCRVGNLLCGQTCYNPTYQTCLKSMLCPIGNLVCGKICYDPSSKTCFSDKFLLCSNTQLRCNNTCYNPALQVCLGLERQLLCHTGQDLCMNNTVCYSPNQKTCFGDRLCPNGKLPCKNGCFRPGKETCDEDGTCAGDNLLSCGTRCYDPAFETCFGTKLCLQGERLCGNSCFNPNLKTCFGEKGLTCKLGQQLCGTTDCYDPNSYTCRNNLLRAHY